MTDKAPRLVLLPEGWVPAPEEATAEMLDHVLRNYSKPDHYRSSIRNQYRELLSAAPSLPEQPATDAAPVAQKRLIGWRTENYLWETSDPKMAKNWEPHIGVLPIFEGDINTKLGASIENADPLQALSDQAQEPSKSSCALNQLINRACSELPEGWNIRIEMERNAGWVELLNPDGEEVEFPSDHEHLADSLLDAIEAALKQGGR